MATSEEILRIAASQVGYHEGKNHDNKYGAWYGLNYEPWCMEFVQWVYAQAGSPLPCKTASCGDLLNWYLKHDPACIVKDPVPGCIVIFDFPKTKYSTDHTGLFVKLESGEITTIDGNTQNTSEPDDNGGWVQQRTRKLSYANPTYIVPRELTDEEDKDVKRYETLEEIRNALPWAVPTIEKLIDMGALKGNDQGLDLTEDMIRLLVINDRAGAYDGR